MKIAVEGCCHGELDKIYDTIAHLEAKEGIKVDLLICCGDFQAVRNMSDLQCMAVPPKYQKLNTFYKYYNGEKKAPIMTIYIGGNHEASNYHQELPYGGWVAPNIYYLGYAGVVKYGGVRIGGLSGIFKGHDYLKGHYEQLPYTESTKRSVYHIRNLEVFRLKQIRQPIDIMMSHDWPRGVYNYGPVKELLRRKKFLREEVQSNTLGSPPAEELLHKLQPTHWFAAHLHVKYAARVLHENESGEEKKETKFLSLDKCLPHRNFLQVIEIAANTTEPKLELDPEWLAILKATNHLLSLSHCTTYMPGVHGPEKWDFAVTEADLAALDADFDGFYAVPDNFEVTAPELFSTTSQEERRKLRHVAPETHINPQTTLMCEMLGITDPNAVALGKAEHKPLLPAQASTPQWNYSYDEGVMDVGRLSDDDAPDSSGYLSELSFSQMSFNSSKRTSTDVGLDDIEEEQRSGDKLDTSSGPAMALSFSLTSDDPPVKRTDSQTDLDSGVSPASQKTDVDSSMDNILNITTGTNTSSLENSLDTSTDLDSSKVEGEGDSARPKKKFKRRNQSIYSAAEES